MGVYNPDGSWKVTVVGQNDAPHSLHAADGSYRVTQNAGLGLYAPNGAFRIGSSGTGYYTPAGAINGVLVGTSFYPRSRLSLGPELIVNGTMDTDLTGWDASASSPPSTVIWSAGQALTQTDGVANARFRQTVSGLIVGKLYSLSRTGTLPTFLGTSVGMGEILNASTVSPRYFIAPTTTVYLSATSSTNGLTLDNVSLRRAT